jgi:hypothetical protein
VTTTSNDRPASAAPRGTRLQAHRERVARRHAQRSVLERVIRALF